MIFSNFDLNPVLCRCAEHSLDINECTFEDYYQCQDQVIQIKEEVKDEKNCNCIIPCFETTYAFSTSYTNFPNRKYDAETFKSLYQPLWKYLQNAITPEEYEKDKKMTQILKRDFSRELETYFSKFQNLNDKSLLWTTYLESIYSFKI